MKTIKIFRGFMSTALFAAIAIALPLITGCDKDYTKDSPFDNVVYIEEAAVKDVSNYSFNRTVTAGEQSVTAMLARPADVDINVSFKADPSLVANYNARLGATYQMLDSKHYKISSEKAVIRKGKITSDPVTISFSSLTDLDIDAGYLLPLTIGDASGGMDILGGSKTLCYIVRRSSAITTAVNLTNNYFEVPGFDNGSPTAEVVNNLKHLTYEAIVKVDKFSDKISSVMGIEQYCLLRLGDSGFPNSQLQFCSPGDTKFPAANNSKLLEAKEWNHVAVTYDTEAKTAVIYVNGIEQSRIENFGNGVPVNLGKQNRGKDYMFKIGHSYGEPDDMSRQLDGEICEVRIWSTIRSQEEIYKNMYDVDPASEGLCAYWKFNEGEGDTAKDYTGRGNDALSHSPAVWPSGIEVPQKNK